MVRKLLKYVKKLANYNENEIKAQTEQKILLIIKARWVVLGLLLLYGTFSVFAYLSYWPIPKIIELATWPFILLCVAVVYNFANHIAWHRYPRLWVKRIKAFIRVQITVDALAVTLLIHFIGGITSWFWTLYILLIIEHFQLTSNQKEILFTGLINISFYSILVFAEFSHVIAPVKIPFPVLNLHSEITYVLVAWFWVCALNIATVYMGSYLHKKDDMAVRDSLTNIYNRRFFEHALKGEVERAKRFSHTVSLLMIDLDNFKKYNDTYGHVEGDKILLTVANVLSCNIRRSVKQPSYDIDIACRYGGEEFVVILPETGRLNGALTLAEKLRIQIACQCNLTVSIGVATYPLDCSNCNELIKAADRALYKAKSLGKNKVAIAPLSALEEKTAAEIVNVANVECPRTADIEKPSGESL